MHTRIGLHSSETYITIVTAKLPALITTFLILPHSILTAIACHLHIIMNGCPCAPVMPCTHASACHCLTLVSLEHSDDGEKESRALNGSHYTHEEMIDAFPFYGLDDDVSIVPNTKEFF
jgi:hypothetical protein